MSTVVATLLIIGLTLVAAGMIWGVVGNLIGDKLESAERCSNLLEKIEIEEDFTCYDKPLNELHISINIKELELDGILVSIANETQAKSFEISQDVQIPYVKNYDGTSYLDVGGQNSGKTYIVKLVGSESLGLLGTPELIEIAPVIEQEQCEVVDSFSRILNC